MPHGRRRSKPDSPSYLQLVHDATARVAPAPAPAPAGTAQRRVVVVPLDEPAPSRRDPAVPRLAPEVSAHDRRQEWPGRTGNEGPAARLVCPSCAIPARVELVDLRQRRLHLSCDRCYRMWQDRVRAGDTVSTGLQRAR